MHRSKKTSLFDHFSAREAARQAVGVGAPAQSFFAVLTHFANMMLGVKLKAKLGNEVELGFEEIDVVLLVRHQQAMAYFLSSFLCLGLA